MHLIGVALSLILMPSSAFAQLTAIVGGTIIDGTGSAPIQDGVLLIEGRRLVAVGNKSTPVSPQARKIVAAGKYVIPGLMDANVHLVAGISPLTLVRHEGRYDELVTEAAQVTLRSGLTTVFDSWGPREYLVKAREAINAGHVAGSRIYLAGNIVGFGGPFSQDFFPAGREALSKDFADRIDAVWEENVGPELMWMSPEQVRQEVRAYLQKDIDFLKYAINGHGLVPWEAIVFSARVQQVIVEEAHRAGRTVQTHTASNEGLYLASQAGVDLIQHCDLTFGPHPVPAETVALIARRRIPCALLARTTEALASYRRRSHDNAQTAASMSHYEIADRNQRALLRAGAVVLLSTDAWILNDSNAVRPSDEHLWIFGEGHFHWLRAVEQKGMKAMDALLAATRNIARAYKVDKDLGTLEKGKIADLLILDRNPLDSAANYRSISLVMKEGRVIDREALPMTRRPPTARTAPLTRGS